MVGSDEKGWIRASDADPHYLAHDDGSTFYGVGMAVPWLVYDDRYYPQPDLLSRLSSYGVNFMNWLFTSWDILLIRDSYERYSMEDAEKFDRLVEDAEQNGIKLMLGIWIHDLLRDAPHPWSGFYDWASNPFNQLTSATGFFSDSTSWEYQEKYYRYIIARWGYSTSIAMWHLVAEINGTNAIYDPYAMKNEGSGWHNQINHYFTDNDPFGHPTTVSGSGGFDFSEGWAITGVPQVHEYPYPADRIRENPDRIAYWSDRLSQTYPKPNLVGEFGKSLYVEGISESFLHNGIWAGLMSGVCATPLHWWGGQIAAQPGNFSTFNETMLNQLSNLKRFVDQMDLAAHQFKSLYSAPPSQQPSLSNMPSGKVYGLRGDSMHLCWVYNVEENATSSFQGVVVTLPDLEEGRYLVSFYDTWNGDWYSSDVAYEASNGKLEMECPDFTGDIAIRIEYQGPVITGEGLDEDPAGLMIFPNPCSAVLNISNQTPDHSFRLMNPTGQVVLSQPADPNSTSRIDLTPYPQGIYLLEVSNIRGIPRTFKIVHY